MTKIKCPICKEKFDPDQEGYYANILESEICQGCLECEEEHSSTIVKFENGEKEKVVYNEYFAQDDNSEIPEWFSNIFDKREYVSTDGWRGYYETKWKNHFVKLADGWVTGFPDETKTEKSALSLNDLLESGECPPVALYWVFEPTSNVFSTASEVFVEESDKKEAIKWLKQNGINPEQLEDFS